MKGVLKRDWEIIRIFLILAILTAGFVWGVQGLILAPTATTRIPGYSLSESVRADRELHRGDIVSGRLGIYPAALNLSLPKPRIPLRTPSSPSTQKRNP